MGRLIYATLASLDGYVEDSSGRFDWAAPDEEVLRFVNELERPIRTALYGRRMYETMLYWETFPLDDSVPDYVRVWTELWRREEKVVYSRTLQSASSGRTRLERSFDPHAVRRLKESSPGDLCVAGANLAGQAIKAGLVDEFQLFAVPVVIGDGKPWLPKDMRLKLELLESRRFESGIIFLRYRAGHGETASSQESDRSTV
jgi:dihydrofolate reductase